MSEGLATRALRLAYADPPYPGMSRRYYGDHPDYAGEVDHGELLERLRAFDGWALSTSSKTLHQVLPLCPSGTRIAAWVKYGHAFRTTAGIQSMWEPVLLYGGRQRTPGVCDWLAASPARGGGHDLVGRKPPAFCAWLSDLLGALPGDELVDLYPGTGTVSRTWAEWGSSHVRGSRARSRGDVSAVELLTVTASSA